MALKFDPSGDFAVFDGLEAVQFTSVSRTGPGRRETVATALRRALSTKELAASNGVYTGGDLAWHVPANQIVNAPKPRDRITDGDGVTWTALTVEKQTLGSRWKLTCRNLQVVHQLNDVIDVETPAANPDRTGAMAVEAWKVRWPGLRCRVQPLTLDVADERLVHGVQTHYEVTLEQDVGVTNNFPGFDRIHWGTRYLEVTGYRNPERIDELPVIEATLKP